MYVLTSRELDAIHRVARVLERRGMPAESRALDDIVKAGTDRREVRASVAARILHVTPQTVRNWVRRGILKGQINDTGDVVVPAHVLLSALELDHAMPYRDSSLPDVSEEEILAEIAAHRRERRAG